MYNHNNSLLQKSESKSTTKTRYKKPPAVKLLEEKYLDFKKRQYPNFPYPPKPNLRDDNSNALTKCVITWIKINGGQAERISSTGRQVNIKGHQKWIKGSGTNGTADISAIIKGRAVKVEVKCTATNDKNQSEGQKIYQKQIEEAGGTYVIARSFTQFYEWFKMFEDE